MYKVFLIISVLVSSLTAMGQNANNIIINDTRTVNSDPSAYLSQVKFEFKERATVGVPGLDTYSTMMTIGPWVDNTGGKRHQLNFNNGGVYFRMGQFAGSWEPWQKLLIEDNTGNTIARSFNINASTVDANTERPAINAGTMPGEIRGIGGGWVTGDNGFLRLSAGGGGTAVTKSFIDLSGYMPSTSDRYQNITFGTSGVERCRIDAFGNFCLGTKDAKGYKLAVNGAAIFTKAVVKNYVNWPDYVFDSTYELPSLESVSSFINENKHLPEMPSASAIEKDGHDLGEVQKILLKKVEELTLYAISQQTELNKKSDEIKELKQKLENVINLFEQYKKQ